ncbi:MAG TPA: hypothetical protein DCZ12_04655 [Gammaproteobacteria bacterium]|nr:hypothetical protein [Gammaproteobacteria bacterium]
MSKFYNPFQPTLTHHGLKQFNLSMESIRPCEFFRGKVFSFLQIKAEIPTPYPVMPDGTQAVYISPKGSMIGGAQLSAQDMHLLEPGEYFGIWFYPGALRHFFDLDLSEITGQFVEKSYFACRYFSQLHNEIYEKNSFKERVNICESWLLSRYLPKPMTNFDAALQLIYQSFGSDRVSWIADRVGWSCRHLNRHFLRHTGLTTKSFSQVVRAQHACWELYKNQHNSKMTTQEMGYFDQSHLIKDFKKHFASTPDDFFSRFMSDLYNN